VIALEGVASRRPPLSRARLSLAWGPGLHSLVGSASDGAPMVLALIAGWENTRAGRLRVLDGSALDARIRPQVAFVPLSPPLAAALSVRETLELAATIRGEPARPAAERLAALGVEALATRRVRSLAPEEARAVAMAEAVTSARVRVLLVEEPLVGLDPRAAGRLEGALRARAQAGCAVVVATASVRDAGDLADDHVLLRQGVVVGQAASLDALAAFTPAGARIRVVSDDPAALVEAIAREPVVEAVARRDGAVVARGREATALAQAVGRALVASGVNVTEMRFDPPSLDEARSAVAGVAQATFDAARLRTSQALVGPRPGTS
jgi:ABC-type multidrug transport system ATPase subunit